MIASRSSSVDEQSGPPASTNNAKLESLEMVLARLDLEHSIIVENGSFAFSAEFFFPPFDIDANAGGVPSTEPEGMRQYDLETLKYLHKPLAASIAAQVSDVMRYKWG